MPHGKVHELPLKHRPAGTIGEACAIAKHSPAWMHGQVAIGLAREEAEREGKPPDESKGKGVKSIKVGGRRLILIDSLLELMGLTRADLPDVAPPPPAKLAPRGLPAVQARARAAAATSLAGTSPPAPADPAPPAPKSQPAVVTLATLRRSPGRRRRHGPGSPFDPLPPAA
jgi:hypothetical protein